MASLAEEFLMDFESSEGEDEEDYESNPYKDEDNTNNPLAHSMTNPSNFTSLSSLETSRKKFKEPAPENIVLDEAELKELGTTSKV